MKLLFFTIASCFFFVNSKTQTMLTVEFENLKESYLNKDLYIAFWSKDQEGFPNADNVEIGDILLITSTDMIIQKELEDGEYAVSCFIDLNGNGKLDTNFFGMPKEPFCFSNNFRPKFAPPKFEDCSFMLDKDLVISLTLID